MIMDGITMTSNATPVTHTENKKLSDRLLAALMEQKDTGNEIVRILVENPIFQDKILKQVTAAIIKDGQRNTNFNAEIRGEASRQIEAMVAKYTSNLPRNDIKQEFEDRLKIVVDKFEKDLVKTITDTNASQLRAYNATVDHSVKKNTAVLEAEMKDYLTKKTFAVLAEAFTRLAE